MHSLIPKINLKYSPKGKQKNTFNKKTKISSRISSHKNFVFHSNVETSHSTSCINSHKSPTINHLQARGSTNFMSTRHTQISSYKPKIHYQLFGIKTRKRKLCRHHSNMETGKNQKKREMEWGENLLPWIMIQQQLEYRKPNPFRCHSQADCSCLSPWRVGYGGACSRAFPHVQCSWMGL